MWYSAVGCLVTLTLSLLAVPLAAEAPPVGKVYRLGILSGTTASITAGSINQEVFRQGLRELGCVEGQNIAIERRYAEGRYERFPDLAAELVRLQVDVLVAAITPAALVAQHATRTIPLVMVSVHDPVGSGLVASLAQPGGNAIGLSLLSPALVGKQ